MRPSPDIATNANVDRAGAVWRAVGNCAHHVRVSRSTLPKARSRHALGCVRCAIIVVVFVCAVALTSARRRRAARSSAARRTRCSAPANASRPRRWRSSPPLIGPLAACRCVAARRQLRKPVQQFAQSGQYGITGIFINVVALLVRRVSDLLVCSSALNDIVARRFQSRRNLYVLRFPQTVSLDVCSMLQI